MRSLPEGCTFSIISFGSPTFSPLFDEQYYQEYNDETRDAAIGEIVQMSPNFGGTDILSPLQAAQSSAHYESGKKKRIFLLTDGQVSNPLAIVDQAKLHSETIRVFTFGLGSGCDKHLITRVARAGRGTHTIVKDGSNDLNGQVIHALGNAMEPSLKAAQFGWNGVPMETDEVFRNRLVF